MKTYGIDVGLTEKSNALVELDSSAGTIRQLPSLAGFKHKLSELTRSKTKAVAQTLCDEILSKKYYPLAVDCALTCARKGKSRRMWETYLAGSFATPAHTFPSPQLKPWKRQWRLMAYLWCEVASCLVAKGGLTLWAGASTPPLHFAQVVIEVYPRTSWTSLHSANRWHLTHYFTKHVPWRDATLVRAGYSWSGAKSGIHARDAAVAALLAYEIVNGSAEFLGEPLVPAGSVYAGGGIGLFRGV